MSNIFNLTKIYLKQIFSNMFASRKKSKGSVITFVILFGFIFFSFFTMFLGYGDILSSANLTNEILIIGFVYFNLLLIIFLSYEIQGYFFKNKDFEIISPLPIID